MTDKTNQDESAQPDVNGGAFHHAHLLRVLLEHLPDKLYFKDLQGRFVMVNRMLLRGFDLDRAVDVLGKTDNDFFSEEHASQAFADEQEVIRTGIPIISKEEKETWPDGRVTWVSSSKMPLRDREGNIIGTFGLSRDITENRQHQEQISEYARELEVMNRQLEADLAMASEVQRSFLPQTYPTFPRGTTEKDSAIRFSHLYRPSGAVGGDLVSVVPLSDKRAGVFICDVMGHGVRSGLITAVVHALLMELAPKRRHPGVLLTEMNQSLSRLLGQMPEMIFTTAFYLTLDASTGDMEFANAGHPKPLLIKRREGVVEDLMEDGSTRGAALALYPETSYITASGKLHPGDRVVMCTDGLFEVADSKSEYFGEERLTQVIRKHMDLPFSDLLDTLMKDVLAFAGSEVFTDDVCIACVELVRLA